MIKRLLAAALLSVFALTAVAPAPVFAAEKKGEKKDDKKEEKKPAKIAPKPKKEGEGGKVGYGDVVIQMTPMMAPYRTSTGVRYELITVRLQLAPDTAGGNERGACFMVPIIHEKMLMYLHSAKLQLADFTGARREVLEKALLDIAVKTTDKSLYFGVKLVDPNSPPLEPGSETIVSDSAPALEQRSLTLSAQCK